MSFLDEIESHLVSQGLGKTPGSTSTNAWTIYRTLMPESPDRVIGLFETSGEPPTAGAGVDKPGLQVRIRGPKMKESTGAYSTARTQIGSIKDTLHEFDPGSISGRHYGGMWAEQEPFSLGYDDNDRPELSCNFRTHRSRTT